MILNEYFGNLQALSPVILKTLFGNFKTRTNSKIGKDSKVEIVKNDKIKDILNNNNSEVIPMFVLRFDQSDKVVFLSDGYSWNYNYLNFDKRWRNYFSRNGVFVIFRDGFDNNLKNVWENGYKNEIPNFDDFLKHINYQLVYADKTRDDKQVKRIINRGDILQVSDKKGYYKDTDRNNPSKVHGSVFDKRDTEGWYKKSLKERLKKYVESKFPSFNSIEDFANANINNILKSFKINGYIYTYDKNATEFEINNGIDPLFNLYKNKQSYIGYIFEGNYWRTITNNELPLYIFFEVVMDVNNKIRVSNIYGASQYYKRALKPISDWFEKKEEPSKEGIKKTDNKPINDEDDDW